MMTGRVLCVLLVSSLMCCFLCVCAAVAATEARVRPAGDGAVTAGHMWAVMAAESEPVVDGSERKVNVNSEENDNQEDEENEENEEDEEGGGSKVGDVPTPTPPETLTPTTRKDQSSTDQLRSITSNPSDAGDVSDSQTHASGQESLSGGPAAGTTSPLPNSSQQAAGGVHAGGGSSSQGSQASGQTVTGQSLVSETAKATPQGGGGGGPGAHHEADHTTKDGGDNPLGKNGNEKEEPPEGSQTAPRPSSGGSANVAPNPAVSIPLPPEPKSTGEATGTGESPHPTDNAQTQSMRNDTTPSTAQTQNSPNTKAQEPEAEITTTEAPTTTTTETPTTTTTTRAPSRLREFDGSLSSSAWVCAPLLLAVYALACTTVG
ncbi:putative mucin TcMUC [Trypanosoma cruzi]|uniref:Mucin TcMUCII, putative n=2 Tax=Trypanosoma cruzi TaxID=5693 RepID=Q4CVU9_TRYCC|nr:mucin TcMUCII, putative [Trypanosoma cruzi]EAN84403.1 mucin TcMUCII, putative [Trypanosoma cruzi]PWV10612.1 putative mucin TcMUC [Trypanosoma cruzi]RNC36940.1 mucin TcMUCII [Trypanosoma cruzi]|eukprot:XP_806254.1 mucin TcMUCII [Trypanosoma cruzi strain CL Brener]